MPKSIGNVEKAVVFSFLDGVSVSGCKQLWMPIVYQWIMANSNLGKGETLAEKTLVIK